MSYGILLTLSLFILDCKGREITDGLSWTCSVHSHLNSTTKGQKGEKYYFWMALGQLFIALTFDYSRLVITYVFSFIAAFLPLLFFTSVGLFTAHFTWVSHLFSHVVSYFFSGFASSKPLLWIESLVRLQGLVRLLIWAIWSKALLLERRTTTEFSYYDPVSSKHYNVRAPASDGAILYPVWRRYINEERGKTISWVMTVATSRTQSTWVSLPIYTYFHFSEWIDILAYLQYLCGILSAQLSKAWWLRFLTFTPPRPQNRPQPQTLCRLRPLPHYRLRLLLQYWPQPQSEYGPQYSSGVSANSSESSAYEDSPRLDSKFCVMQMNFISKFGSGHSTCLYEFRVWLKSSEACLTALPSPARVRRRPTDIHRDGALDLKINYLNFFSPESIKCLYSLRLRCKSFLRHKITISLQSNLAVCQNVYDSYPSPNKYQPVSQNQSY